MTESPEPSDQPPGTPVPSPGMVNPKTTPNLLADYEALMNDLQQANGLAADFQRQLAWKSNECAQFKQIFEKTCKDLAHLQTSIAALREERHRLANEAMMVTALKLKFNKVAAERDTMRLELEAARGTGEETARALRTRDQQVAELTLKVVTLKEVLVEAQQRTDSSAPLRSAARAPMTASMERPGYEENQRDSADEGFIDIAFDR